MTKLPNELGNLKKLTELNIDENKIQNLPQTIGGCEKLEVLNSNQNRLVDLPKGMSLLHIITAPLLAHILVLLLESRDFSNSY